MDPLSQLLMLNTPEGRLDKNCLLGGEWQLPHAAGELSLISWHAVINGSAWLEIPSGQPLRLPPTSVLMLPQNSAHRLHQHSSEATQLLCGSLRLPPTAHYFLSALPEVLLLAPETDTPEQYWLTATLSLLQHQSRVECAGAEAINSQQIAAIFTIAVRQWLTETAPDNGVLKLALHPRLGSLISKLFESPAFPWTVESMAQQVFMSQASFARLFRQLSGSTPLSLLTRLRLQIAAQRLARSRTSVLHIAASVGYASESSFHKAFARQFGCPPGDYRRRAQQLGPAPFSRYSLAFAKQHKKARRSITCLRTLRVIAGFMLYSCFTIVFNSDFSAGVIAKRI